MHWRLGRSLTILWTFLGVRVGQDYDPHTDFMRYKSFAWAPVPQEKTGRTFLDHPFFNKRVRDAVESFLIQHGYARTTEGESDFLIETHIIVKRRVAVDRTGEGWPGNRYFGDSFFETTVDEYEDGTLIIDFLDPGTKKLFWRGTGSRRVAPSSSPQKSAETIDRWVSEILKQYPPQSKSTSRAPAGCSGPLKQGVPTAPQA